MAQGGEGFFSVLNGKKSHSINSTIFIESFIRYIIYGG
jgi:hypothetical protein